MVESESLAVVLAGFVEHWNRERVVAAGRPYALRGEQTDVAQFGAISWLARESGVPVKTIQNIARVDGAGKPRPRNRHTELRIADSILMAIGRPDLLRDDTLQIRPNPLAKAEARAGCCTSRPPAFEPWSLAGV